MTTATATASKPPPSSGAPRTGSRSPSVAALRHSAGLYALPVLMVVEIVNAYARHRVWAIDWRWTAYWSNASTLIVCPLAAAVGAAESILYRRRRAEGLLGVGRDRTRNQALRAGATALWAMAAHLVGVLCCALAAVRMHGSLHLPIWPTLPAFAAIAGATLVGAAIGWRWPSLAAPPLIAIAGVALAVLLPAHASLGELIRVDAATVGLSGLRTRATFTIAHVLWWTAVGLGAMRLLARPPRLQPRWDVPVPLVVILATVGVISQGDHGFARDRSAPRWACSTTTPVVCVLADYQPVLAPYAAVTARISAALGELDPAAVPSRVEQDGPRVAGRRFAGGTVAIPVFPTRHVDPFGIAFTLVQAASGCPHASMSSSAALDHDMARLGMRLVKDAGFEDYAGDPDQAIATVAQARQVLASLKTEC